MSLRNEVGRRPVGQYVGVSWGGEGGGGICIIIRSSSVDI